jgi:hypothetical protein
MMPLAGVLVHRGGGAGGGGGTGGGPGGGAGVWVRGDGTLSPDYQDNPAWTGAGREGQVALVEAGGKLLLFGGVVPGSSSGGLGQLQTVVEEFNPATNLWTTRPSLPAQTLALPITVGCNLGNGKVLLINGGQNALLYDIVTGAITVPAQIGLSTLGAFAFNALNLCVLSTGKAIVSSVGQSIAMPPAAFMYDATTDTWSPTAPPPSNAPYCPICAGEAPGIVYVSGQLGFAKYTASTDSWQVLSAPVVSKGVLSMLNNTQLLLTTQGAQSWHVDTWVYTIASGTWAKHHGVTGYPPEAPRGNLGANAVRLTTDVVVAVEDLAGIGQAMPNRELLWVFRP